MIFPPNKDEIDAPVTAKIAAMTWDQRNARCEEFKAHPGGFASYDEAVEFVKIIFGLDAGIGPDVPDLSPSPISRINQSNDPA